MRHARAAAQLAADASGVGEGQGGEVLLARLESVLDACREEFEAEMSKQAEDLLASLAEVRRGAVEEQGRWLAAEVRAIDARGRLRRAAAAAELKRATNAAVQRAVSGAQAEYASMPTARSVTQQLRELLTGGGGAAAAV